MAAIELKFIPVGFIHPKTETGKKGSRWERDNPLNYSSRIEGNKFYLFFSITKLNNFSGKPLLYLQISDEKNKIIRDNTGTGGHTINQAGLEFFKTDRIDRSSGLFLRANEVLEPTAIESSARMIHGKAWITANNRQISNIVTFSMEKTPTIGTGFERGAGATLQRETTQKTGGFELLPEAAGEEMLTHSRIDTSIKQNFVNMRITKNDKIQGRINFTALGFNEFFKAGQTVTNIFIIKDINGAELGMFPESYLKFGQSETLDMIEHRDIIGFSAYNQNELIIESYVWTNDYSVALAPMIKQKIVKEAPTPEPTPTEPTPEEAIDLDFNGVSTPATTQGGEEILVTEPTEPAKPTKPAEALPIGFTGIIAALVVLGGLFSWRKK